MPLCSFSSLPKIVPQSLLQRVHNQHRIASGFAFLAAYPHGGGGEADEECEKWVGSPVNLLAEREVEGKQ
jgi:hypothetical protein